MLRSLFSGITGLRAHQTMMDVVSNDIANVNTTGFKSSSVVFEDTLSQLLKAAGSPTTVLGGVNAAQVGLGVQLGTISTNFGQGSAQNTGRSTDLMIQGDGFFMVRTGNEIDYTRAGAFSFDSNGTLANPEGMVVQGWMGVNGVVDTNAAATDIVIPANTVIPAKASSQVTLTGNIPPSVTNTDVLTLGQTVYDLKGLAHQLTITLTNDGTGGYTVDVVDAVAGATPTQGSITFNPDGTVVVGAAPSIALADGTTVNLDLSKVTNYGGPKTLNIGSADGYPAGSLQSFQIGADGSVTGMFSNGQKLTLAKVALAAFNNPMGLEKIGDTCYRSTTNSGTAMINAPGGGGVGTLIGGSLEMSNVDLAQEFTNLIIAQRGFQANSRVITTSDQMLQDLVNIKQG